MAGLIAVVAIMLPAASDGSTGGSITRLKDMHLETQLAREGRTRCMIVIPDEDPEIWRRLARTVQKAVADAGGAEPEITSATTAGSELGDNDVILLGSANNNGLILRLYAKHYCFTDCEYPGPGGAEVRTIHNPLGEGRNYVLLGGSDRAGVEKATEKFISLLREGNPALVTFESDGSVQLGRINWSDSVHNHAEPDESSYFKEATARLRRQLDSGVVVAAMLGACDTGMCYYQTGREVYGRVFRDLLLHYCDLAEPEGDWVLTKMFGGDSDRYFFPLRLIPTWDLIEEGEVFSDADRLRITNLLLQITRWVSRLDYFDPQTPHGRRYGWPGEIRNNHATFATLSLFNGCEYFRRYYPAVQDWTAADADVANIFDGQRSSYRPDDNSATYFNYAPNHFLDYLFTRGDWSYMEEGKLRQIADMIIMTVDNRADLSTYGDEIEYKIGFEKGLPLLAKAAWYYHDGRYLWARDWLKRRSARVPGQVEYMPRPESIERDGEETEFTFDGWYDGPYNLDIPRVQPDHLLGIHAMPMDEGLYSFARRHGTGRAIPIEKTFDKMSWRRDFDPEHEYLFMGGFSGALSHSHEDGNALVRLTWNDRVWLADMHYRRKLVDAHNSLLVLRNWKYENIPTFTALEARADFPDSGFTATSVRGYNGVDWTRNIVWGKGRYFLVLDDVQIREKGEYALTMKWRTLGDIDFRANTLNITQDGETFHIANADDSSKLFSEEPSDGRFVVWNTYDHSDDAVVRIMSEKQEGVFEPNDRLTYINLLFPKSNHEFTIERIKPRVIEILADGRAESIVGLADEGGRIGDLEVTARLFRLARHELELIDVTRLSDGKPLLESERPISLRVDLETGEAVVMASADSAVAMRAEAVSSEDQSPLAANGLRKVALTAGASRLKLGAVSAWRNLARELDRPHAALRPASSGRFQADSGLTMRWQRRDIGPAEVGDLDGDGEPEIVAASADRLMAFSADGEETWACQVDARVQALRLADVDGDGRLEIIAGTEAGTVYLLDGEGRERWRRACIYRPGPITAIATAALTHDGSSQILAGSQGYVLYAFGADGRPLWHNMIDIPWGGVADIVAGDLDGDDRPEIFVATGADHGDVLLSGDGRSRWRLSGTTKRALAVDLAGNGRKSIIVGGPMQAGPLRAVDPTDGSIVWNAGIDDDVSAIIPLRRDDRGARDLLVGYSSAGLWRLDSRGGKRRICGFPSLLNTAVNAPGNEAPRLVAGCEDGKVYVVDATGTTRASLTLDGAVVTVRAFEHKGRLWIFAVTRDGAATAMEMGEGSK